MKLSTNYGVVVYLLISLLILVGCYHDDKTLVSSDLYINHYKSECGSRIMALCLQSRVSENDTWTNFYDPIIGFEYEWGYNYQLKVSIENIENPPQDSSSLKYTLLEVVEKEKESTTSLFDISVSRISGLISKESNNVYKIYADKLITCVTIDCATIDSLMLQDMAILFEFKHQSDPLDPLVLTQIKCSSSRESFRNSCL